MKSRVTKKLSQEFSRILSRILGALPKLEDFFLTVSLGTCPGVIPESKWRRQETVENRSQKTALPGMNACLSQSSQEISPEEKYYMVTAVHEEFLCCSSGVSSSKQKKTRSTMQPQFHSENTPATIEADQACWPYNNWRATSNSENFNNNFHRASKQCSLQQCPPLMRISNCLKSCSKQDSNSTSNKLVSKIQSGWNILQ